MMVGFAFVMRGSFAQSALDSLRLSDRLWSMKKKALILERMQLTEAEKSSFWPVYENYSNASRYLELEYLMLAGKYTRSSQHCSSSELEDISTRMLSNDLKLAKLRKQYYKKFKHALSARKATEFIQIDNMFRSMIRLESQENFLISQENIPVMAYTRQ